MAKSFEAFSDYFDSLNIRYSWIKDSISGSSNPVEAVSKLNNEIKTWLKFDLRSHAALTEPSILEVLEQKKGSCKSLTQFTTQACRSVGIPVTIDECPFWAHRNSGHQWNVVLDESGKWIPFAGAEKNPDEFDIINDSMRVPKIFRYQYSKNPSFYPPDRSKGDVPAAFIHPNRTDVTSEYVSTSEVDINLEKELHGDIVYLSVFNAFSWRIVAWSIVNDKRAHFS